MPEFCAVNMFLHFGQRGTAAAKMSSVWQFTAKEQPYTFMISFIFVACCYQRFVYFVDVYLLYLD